ncbi:hypothetical protein BDW59DRAFT_152687, partial [Aspergillus cavernicola]
MIAAKGGLDSRVCIQSSAWFVFCTRDDACTRSPCHGVAAAPLLFSLLTNRSICTHQILIHTPFLARYRRNSIEYTQYKVSPYSRQLLYLSLVDCLPLLSTGPPYESGLRTKIKWPKIRNPWKDLATRPSFSCLLHGSQDFLKEIPPQDSNPMNCPNDEIRRICSVTMTETPLLDQGDTNNDTRVQHLFIQKSWTRTPIVPTINKGSMFASACSHPKFEPSANLGRLTNLILQAFKKSESVSEKRTEGKPCLPVCNFPSPTQHALLCTLS